MTFFDKERMARILRGERERGAAETTEMFRAQVATLESERDEARKLLHDERNVFQRIALERDAARSEISRLREVLADASEHFGLWNDPPLGPGDRIRKRMHEALLMSAGERQFPLMVTEHERALGAPTSVPWSLVKPHELQAHVNHEQTLERIAARGGLAPFELVAVLEDRLVRPMPSDAAVAGLKVLLASLQPGTGRIRRASELTPVPTSVAAGGAS